MNHTPRPPRNGEHTLPPARRAVSGVYLLELLNQRLARHRVCGHCRFLGPILRLAEPADDGRNWNRWVPLSCEGSTPGACQRFAERILDETAREYNLIDSVVEDLWAAPKRPEAPPPASPPRAPTPGRSPT